MKLRNKSGLLAAIAGLAAVSMFSVGFAAWVLSATDSEETQGNITVESINASAVYYINDVDVEGSFHFGVPSATQISGYQNLVENRWLTFDQNSEEESLTVTVKVEVTNIDDSNLNHIDISIASTAYDAAATAGYVKPLSQAVITETYDSVDEVVVYTITLGWGELFNYKNPYEYYNTQEKSQALVEQATQRLQGIATALTGAEYTITVATND